MCGDESKSFIERLKELRKIEQSPEVFENANTIAFINDIHGNADALRALLDECRKCGKKDIFILGDMIGFGPQSNECLDILREAQGEFNIRCVLGNHEMYSLMGNKSFEDYWGFHPEMTRQIRKEMSNENRRFIESFPITRKIVVAGKNIELAHFPIRQGYDLDIDIYVDKHNENALSMTASGKNQDYLIYGHEHRTTFTSGDEVGTIGIKTINSTEFVNLPSSGCVHGNRTSYVTIGENNGNISLEVVPVYYNRENLDKALNTSTFGHADKFSGIGNFGGGSGER